VTFEPNKRLELKVGTTLATYKPEAERPGVLTITDKFIEVKVVR